MNRVLLILSLVSVLGSQGKSVLDVSHGARSVDPAVRDGNGRRTNISDGELFVEGSSTESTTVPQQKDQDPSESSETIVYNRLERPSENDEESSEEEEDPEGPPDHVIPYSEHEEPRDVPTKPKHTVPGEWAKPPKDKEVPLDFVPTKLYAQVRKTHTLKRLPRKKAIENAESEEEKENAARLRAVVKNSKVNTVYTEEGYEDSAYDHAGHIRDADFEEEYARKLHNRLKLKKGAEGDDHEDDEEEENAASYRKHKKTRPGEYKDSDRYKSNESKWKSEINPKLVAEEGIGKLQEDVEREAEEIEKGHEVNKLEKVEATTDGEVPVESRNRDEYNGKNEEKRKKGKRKRPPSMTNGNRNQNSISGEEIRESQISRKIHDEGRIVSTTLAKNLENRPKDSSGAYEYSSRDVDSTNSERAEDSPTTVNYSQLLWDYFKTRQKETTTIEVPLNSELTTLDFTNFGPHSIYQQTTTSFPIIESATWNPQQIDLGQTLIDPEYSTANDQNAHLISTDSINMNPYSEIYNDNQQILFSSSPKNLDRSDQNFDITPMNRKPRYKITVRPKPKKPDQFQATLTSNPITKPLTEPTTPESLPINENYMKVLLHLQNERNVKKAHRANDFQQNSFHPRSNKNNLEDLTRLRPPSSQPGPDYYYNYVPRSHSMIDATQSAWVPLPVAQRYHRHHPNLRTPHSYPDFPHPSQRYSYNRKRNLGPAYDPQRPTRLPRGDSNWQKEPADYANRPGNGSQRGGDARWPPRRAHGFDGARGIRSKSRERRSARGAGGDESSVVKGLRPVANNATSNRGEVERAGKNPSIERNCRQKVRRGVGLVMDVSRAKQPGEKKSRSSAIDRGEGSRAAERESSVDGANGNDGVEGGLDSRAVEYDGRGTTGGGSTLDLAKKRRRFGAEEFRGEDESGGCEEFVNEASQVIENVDVDVTLRKEVNFDGEEPSEVKDELEGRKELSAKESKVVESTGSSNETTSAREQQSKTENEFKKHEELLNEAPKVAEDVVEKEIKDRFGRKEEDEEEDDEEDQVEVEFPEFDYVEELPEEEHVEEAVNTEASLNVEKYPFYNSEKMPTPSALKYAIDPRRLPAKTYGAMEFYNLRDAYKHCEEVEPNLEVLPKKEEPVPERGPNENLPRLRGLGDKLDCFKAKYFDENPFDNPLFLEKQVGNPTLPSDIDSTQFASRIMMLPKQNDDYVIQKSSRRPEAYRQSRGHGSGPVRFQKRRRIRYKAYPRTRTRTRKMPQGYRLQASRLKYAKTTRKPQKVEKRPVTAASEISSFYAPYQNQVYEDVMGTIRNMANLYKVHEVTTTPASEETTVVDDVKVDIKVDAKTNSSKNSTGVAKKEKASVMIDIMKRPTDMDIHIKGLAPPRHYSRYRGVYKRVRASQNSRPRIQRMPQPVLSLRTVTRRQKVRVYKRDLTDHLNSDEKERLLATSDELDSVKKVDEEREASSNVGLEEKANEGTKDTNDGITREQDNDQQVKPKNSTNKIESIVKTSDAAQSFSVRKNSTSPKTDPKTNHITRRVTVLRRVISSNSSSSHDRNQRKEKPEKVVYTIKDRIRHSKPKEEEGRVGMFTKEAEVEQDTRRKEPKYNYIRRKNPVETTSTTSTTTESSLLDNWTETTMITKTVTEPHNQQVAKENRVAQYAIDKWKNDSPNASQKVDYSEQEDMMKRPDEEAANKTGTGYAVYENVDESGTTTTERPQLVSSTEFFNLKTFFETEIPSYTKLSTDDFKNSFFLNDNNSSDYSKMKLDATNTTDVQQEKKEVENTSKTFFPSYVSDEQSSERTEANPEVQLSTESSDESSSTSKESDSNVKTFFSYTSRPISPAENYEDEKYTELGPRVNKPAFFHPPFSLADHRKSPLKENSEESGEAKEEYVFPWQKDKEDQRKRKRIRQRDKMTGEYEYPWERRERLAQDEKRIKEEKRRKFGRSFDDDEDDSTEASTATRQKYVRPRGRHRYKSRLDRDTLEDVKSSSSEHRPVMKYSSRYNSNNTKLPLSENSRSVEEISRSIKKVLEGDSEEKVTSTEKDDSLEEKKPGFYRIRSVSRGIVPEDVTQAPARKLGKKEKPAVGNSSSASTGYKNSNEFRMSVVNSSPKETGNSTKEEAQSAKPSIKKRRRPFKNTASAVEATTKSTIAADDNRTRRRQKSASTTSATPIRTTSGSPISTTSASRVIRRRNQKPAKNSQRNEASRTWNKSVKVVDSGADTGTSKTGTAERSRGRKKARTNEIASEQVKNSKDPEVSADDSKKTERSETVDDDRGKNPGNETEGKNSIGNEEKKTSGSEEKSINEVEKKNVEENAENQDFALIKNGEQYDIKDDGVETLSDIDKPVSVPEDDEFDFGSIIKTEDDLVPKNRAVQLSELESREIVSSVSWTSENYDF
ncbi:unnamed protein product [Xylocopa violacea]|uniref:Uncharacterized protein n=1 Tax=Xylocopa violacea TaxID=135666 RepID=A0ABP1PL16_XYLVO